MWMPRCMAAIQLGESEPLGNVTDREYAEAFVQPVSAVAASFPAAGPRAGRPVCGRFMFRQCGWRLRVGFPQLE